MVVGGSARRLVFVGLVIMTLSYSLQLPACLPCLSGYSEITALLNARELLRNKAVSMRGLKPLVFQY